jgi:hypothetical protein
MNRKGPFPKREFVLLLSFNVFDIVTGTGATAGIAVGAVDTASEAGDVGDALELDPGSVVEARIRQHRDGYIPVDVVRDSPGDMQSCVMVSEIPICRFGCRPIFAVIVEYILRIAIGQKHQLLRS